MQSLRAEGELQILQQDFKDRSQVSYSLKQADGTQLPLQFSKPPAGFLSGDHVQATGQLSGGTLLLASGDMSLTSTSQTTGTASSTTAGPLPNTFGVQYTLVMLVNFQDAATQPYTVADAQNMFFNSADSFMKENSFGQTSLAGTVVGWYTIPDSVTACNISQIATDAQKAAVAAGVKLANYTRYVYAFPQNNVCGWAGSSYVGGNPSQSWINGNALDLHTVVHELGHAFGLWHSHLLNCGTTATICSNGTVIDYGDIVDVMGASQPAAPQYNAFQKESLGWLNYGASPSILTVSSSGTYTISSYELSGSGPNALKVLKSVDPTTGAKTWYYMEARQSIGSDAFLTNGTCANCAQQTVTNGVLLHMATDNNGNSDDLLDTTPATPSYYWWFDPTLVVGQSFQDAGAGLTVKTTAVSASATTVQVTLSGSACTPANPSVSMTPSQSASAAAGTAVSFTLSVKDNDSSACPAATFDLADAVPSGWAGTWNAPALSLSPGATGTAALTVTSPAGAAGGNYAVAASATNHTAAAYTASTTATYALATAAPLSTSVTTNQPSYLAGQTVGISVTMSYGTVPDSGASVTVTITPPGGRPTTLTATTGSNGVALFSYKLARHAASGTYMVQGGAAPTGAAGTAGATTSFAVQ